MSVSNIEINFSSNGGAHQATVTNIIGQTIGGNISVSETQIGSEIFINNDEINSLLSNIDSTFFINEIVVGNWIIIYYFISWWEYKYLLILAHSFPLCD